MKQVKKIIEKRWVLFLICSVIFLSLITFWQVLSLGLWRDDFGFLWAAQYHPDLNLPWNLHPGTKYEDILLFKIFGYNAILWQGFGICLRILAALSIAFMMWGFFKSKWISVLSGLFFAVSFAGLETVSWRSVHIVPIDIIFISLGFYFISQFSSSRRKGQFFFSLLFFDLAVIADPARSIPVIVLLSLLQIINWWIDWKKLKKVFAVDIAAFTVLAVSMLVLLVFSHVSADPRNNITQIMEDPTKIGNFFTSVGNLLFGWFFNIYESGGLASYSNLIAYSALFIVLGSLVISSFIFFKKRSKSAGFFLFFILWILVFYVPNWIFDKNLVVAGTHRYVGISGVGVVAMLALLLEKVKYKKIVLLLTAIIIFLNIQTSQRILKSESPFRLKTVSDKIWNQINADVPNNEKNNIFMYMGTDGLRAYILDLSGGMPFAITRGITIKYDVPIPTSDYNLIVKLLCEKNVNRPAVIEWEKQKTIIPLSRVHAWEINNGIMHNVSQRERKILKDLAQQKKCEVIQ